MRCVAVFGNIDFRPALVEQISIPQRSVPIWCSVQWVPIVDKYFHSTRYFLTCYDAHDDAESWVEKSGEMSIWFKTVTRLVAGCGAVLGRRHAVLRDVQTQILAHRDGVV